MVGDKIEATFTFLGNYGNWITKKMVGIIVKEKGRLRLKCDSGELIRIDKLDKGSIRLTPPTEDK